VLCWLEAAGVLADDLGAAPGGLPGLLLHPAAASAAITATALMIVFTGPPGPQHRTPGVLAPGDLPDRHIQQVMVALMAGLLPHRPCCGPPR
jgi:hypothetical protein